MRANDDYKYESKRLIEISDALRSLQKKSYGYLESYERSRKFPYLLIKNTNLLKIVDWKGFKQGFLAINVQLNPKDITNFEVCALGNNEEAGYVSPETKKVLIFIILIKY